MSETKRGRGRPAGVSSFSKVTLKELNELFGEDQEILVSRVFLEGRAKAEIKTSEKKEHPPIEATLTF
ncbi:hypothetical protein N9955_00350 [bacterium]|nr:hypothetical protein [bacterium]